MMLKDLAEFIFKKELPYDSIGISDDGMTIGIGFRHNEKNSIVIWYEDDDLNISFHKRVGALEAIKFAYDVLDHLPMRIKLNGEFE